MERKENKQSKWISPRKILESALDAVLASEYADDVALCLTLGAISFIASTSGSEG